MARIENRSRYSVAVQNRTDLTRTFPFSAGDIVAAHIADLKRQGFKPKVARLNDSFLVRIRQTGYPDQNLMVGTLDEAIELEQRIDSERRRGLFVDYTKGWEFTFADLLARYLREEGPRKRSFEVMGYKINALLQDSGHPRLDLGEILSAHPNVHPSLRGWKPRVSNGKAMHTTATSVHFMRKRFAEMVPEDFNDYIDDRCQSVEGSTVDREVDIFSAVCRIAIDTWRIPVAKSPMDGVKRPKYFNERDRRLKGDEEARLLDAARSEDRKFSVARRLEELMADERTESDAAATVYARKGIVKAAREEHLPTAEATAVTIPLFETLVHFQLMTGARRGETLALRWSNVDLEQQTAFLPETKNGRPRKLPLRSALVEMLRQLPQEGELVFPIGVDWLRKAWARMCEAAGLVGDDELRIHDLRHEAISRVADTGGRAVGGFSLVDLQAFSGHRDTRMLLRYAHLCAHSLAKRLDAAFADDDQSAVHRGVRRLKKGATVTMLEVVAFGAGGEPQDKPEPAPDGLAFPRIVDPFEPLRRVA